MASDRQVTIRQIQANQAYSQEEKKRRIKEIDLPQSKYLRENKNNDIAKTCEHYPHKKCSQLCFDCCSVIDPCHRCHMQNRNCQNPIISSIICSLCNHKQKLSNECENCGINFGKNYCSTCKLWTEFPIYHCNDCGICRVGIAEENFHCTTCEACFSIKSKQNHKCSATPFKSADCPICLESIHSSQKASVIVPCGHIYHQICYESHVKQHNFQCCLCRKSLYKINWKNLRNLILSQPIISAVRVNPGDILRSKFGKFQVMNRIQFNTSSNVSQVMYEGHLIDFLRPGSYCFAVIKQEDLIKTVPIMCYDCGSHGESPFHYLGMECQHCGSFNTTAK